MGGALLGLKFPGVKNSALLYFHFAPFLSLMTHHEEMQLNANRNPNPNPKGGTKVQ